MNPAASTAKTWGPFTGRQLTTIIVALIMGVVLLPSTVWAVDTFSNVAIQDPVSGLKAKVDTARKLTVGDGAGNLTVDGAVSAVPRPPTSPWSYSRDLQESGDFIAGPSTTPINVTSLSFGSWWADGDTIVRLEAFSVPSTATTCVGANYVTMVYRVFQPTSAGAFAVSFPTPLQSRAPSGQKLCLFAYAGGAGILLNVSGYNGS